MSSLYSISDEARDIIIRLTVGSPITIILHAYEEIHNTLKSKTLIIICKIINCKAFDIENIYNIKLYKLEKNKKEYTLYENINITKEEYMKYYYELKNK